MSRTDPLHPAARPEHREMPAAPDRPQPAEEPGQTPDFDPPPTTPRSNPERDEEKIDRGREELDRVVGN